MRSGEPIYYVVGFHIRIRVNLSIIYDLTFKVTNNLSFYFGDMGDGSPHDLYLDSERTRGAITVSILQLCLFL